MSLIYWWPLTANATDQISGAALSGSANLQSGGKIGDKYARQNSSQLTANNLSELANLTSFSIAMWVRLSNTSNSSQWSDLFGLYFSNGSQSDYFRAEVNSTGGNNFDIYNNGVSGTSAGAASFSLTKNAWTHLIIIKNKGTITSYINGTKSNSTNWTSLNSAYATGEFHIGNGGMYCDYNDVRIYNHCLSPREIKLLAQGLMAHYKLDNSGNFDPSRLSGITHSIAELNGATRCTWGNYFGYPCFKLEIDVASFSSWSGCWIDCIPTNHGAQTGDVVTRSCKMYVPSGQTFPGSFGEAHERGGTRKSVKNYDRNKCDTWQTVSQTVELGTNGSGSSKLIHYFYAADKGYDPVKFTCYLRDFQLEYGTEATEFTPLLPSNMEYDCSGYGNHGTKSAILEASTGSPRYSRAAQFKDNKYIQTTRNNYEGMKNTYSIVYWAQKDDDMNGKMAWGFYDGSHSHYLDLFPSSGKLTLNNGGVGYGNPSDVNLQFGSGVANPDTNWHHYAIIGDTNTVHLYLDGEFKGSTSTLYTIPNAPLVISGWNSWETSSYGWNNGKISDFRLYATALSAAAVKELYQSSISFLDNGTLQCSEIVERPTNLKYNQNGITQAKLISEIGYIDKMKIKTLSDGSTWARIHWLDVTTNTTAYFANEAEVQECVNQTNRFSLIKYINKFKSKNNQYEFMLTYPKISTTLYNRWTQNTFSNNVNDGDSIVFNLNPDSAWKGHAGPLKRAQAVETIYDCDNKNTGNWYAPIGQVSSWGASAIPAANESSTTETELWIRIDNLPKLTKLSMLDDAIQAFQIYEL